MSEKLIVHYQTRKEYCSCCNREFDLTALGEVKGFEINIDDVFAWADWDLNTADEDFLSAYEEDAPKVVEEFIYDTISFHAVNSNEVLQVDEADINKVVEITINKIKNR